MLTVATERFDRRLAAVECNLRQDMARMETAFRVALAEGLAKIRTEISDTRAEVLVQESRRTVTGRCTVVRGRWFSSYDRHFWRRAGDVDIDHVVPLFEVWRSGGRRWTPARRVAYANDLADARTLKAVTDNVNQSKGDSDPAHWLPAYGRCVYVAQYAAVKIRWTLKVDAAEKRAMRQVAAHCHNVMITVHRARVVTRSRGGGATDPRFATCAEAIAHGYGPY